MSQMSTYLMNALLSAHLRNVPYSSPQKVYVGLFNGDPAAGGTEITGGAYARQQATFIAPTNGQLSNDVDILFPIATAAWGNITHICIFDALAGGNILWAIQAEFPQTIDISQQYKIPQNYLILRMT